MDGYPRDAFFKITTDQGLALTFGDVRLKSGHSKTLPDDVDLSTFLTKKIQLKIPLVAAAMDTVTESKMATEMARRGGIGIIHKNLSPLIQANEVSRTKFNLNGRIVTPITVYSDQTVESVLQRKIEKQYGFDTFPVTKDDKDTKLLGLVTKNDFDFVDDLSVLVKDVMSTNLVTAPEGTKIKDAYKIMIKEKKKVLPLVNRVGQITGMYLFSDVKRIVKGTSTDYNVDKNGQLRVGAAIGVNDAMERLEYLVAKGVDVVVMDSAHGDSVDYINRLKQIKDKYPDLEVVAGNVSEPESVVNLIKAGADGVKVGQGSITHSAPMAHIVSGAKIPEGVKLNAYLIPLCMTVCPAFSPEFDLTTNFIFGCCAIASTVLPFPSSPK